MYQKWKEAGLDIIYWWIHLLMFITHNQQRPKFLTLLVDAVVLSPTRKEFSNFRRVLTRPNDKNCFIIITGYACPTASILWCRGRLVRLSSVIELTEKFQFDYVRLPNQSNNNPTDWVRLSSIDFWFDFVRLTALQSWTKVLRTVLQYSYFLSFFGSLLKHCILLEIFLRFALPPPYTKLKLGGFWIHASKIVCGVRGGVGPVWIGKRPRMQTYPKTSVHDCILPILSLGTVPNIWCNGIITSIFKSGARNDPSNYHGICVSSCLGKLFLSILDQRLLGQAVSLNVFRKSQIGFLPKIEHQIMFLPYEL